MQLCVVSLALTAYFAVNSGVVNADGVHQELTLAQPSLGTVETTYGNQPVVVVRKTTYYEPELVAVVVEKGVDNIPEESYLIQNYADVLASSNSEIRLCSAENNNHCLDTPVTKLLVPSLFQSIGQTGFKKFFDQAKQVPWVSTVNDNVELVKPIISPKTPVPKILEEKPIQVVSPDVFRYVPQVSTVAIPEYLTSVFPPQTSFWDIAQTRVPSSDLTSSLQAGFVPLNQITTGGSLLGGTTTRTTYQQTPTNPYVRQRRALY